MSIGKISPLHEISGYNELLDYVKNNIETNKDWQKWLKFNCVFDKPGKQGIVGLFDRTDGNNKKIVFKISQYINYLIHHEYTVMNSLNEISPYCPHFCKALGTIICKVEPGKKDGNPFGLNSKFPIEKEVLLTEYIDESCKFYNYIRSKTIDENIIFSTIKQVLMAISIAQRKKRFTHYDLHSYNIMMKKCDKDVVFLYVLDEDNQFVVPTMGHYPVIIDFGFSYVQDMENKPCWPSMGHTDVGFNSDRFDWVSDPKLFLTTVSGELRNKRKTRKTRKFKNVVKNIFSNLKIDFQSGWDTGNELSAIDHVIDMIQGYGHISRVFGGYTNYCFDIIQSLVILPLEPQNYENIGTSYTTFLLEFIKIENEISNPFYILYILKGIVNLAREVRSDYLQPDGRNNALKWFRNGIHERINCISSFCRPKDIHYEKMLCGLLCLSKNIEGILYDVMDLRMTEKNKQYKKLPLKSVEQIYGAIETNIPNKYEYNENTRVFVMDCVNEVCEKIELTSEDINELNNSHSFLKGSYLYDKIKTT